MIQLNLQYNGITIDLQSGGRTVLDGFYPQVAAEPNGPSISDRVDVWLQFSSAADAEDKVRALNRAFAYARAHPEGYQGCWVNFAIDGGLPTWRSRVRDGFISYDANLLRRYRQGRVLAALTILRDPYWEGAETQVPLTNANGANNTAGLKIYNCNDQSGASPNKRTNLVQIAAGSVAGDLPAACRLEVTNTTNDANGVSQLYVGHNVNSVPAAFNPILEAESAIGGSPIADGSCSGGSYRQYTLDNSGEIDMFTWTLSAALLAQTNGLFRVIARFLGAANTDVWLRPALYYNSVVPLWYGTPVRPSDQYARIVRDLGIIQLPPWLGGLASPSALSLRLTGRRTTGSNVMVNLDYLMLMPMDGYRRYELTGSVPYLSTLVDDALHGMRFVQDGAAANRQGNVIGYGNGFRLVPGVEQALYFQAHSGLADVAEITRTMSVKLYYRPRVAGL